MSKADLFSSYPDLFVSLPFGIRCCSASSSAAASDSPETGKADASRNVDSELSSWESRSSNLTASLDFANKDADHFHNNNFLSLFFSLHAAPFT